VKKVKFLCAGLTIICTSFFNVHASQNDFCMGFTEGYKSIKGDMVMVPMCPLAPLTPLGSTDFREGIKAGIRAAAR
jgi:hypothetical protein